MLLSSGDGQTAMHETGFGHAELAAKSEIEGVCARLAMNRLTMLLIWSNEIFVVATCSFALESS